MFYKDQDPTLVQTVLGSSQRLGFILKKARNLAKLQRIVDATLDDSLKGQCKVMNVSGTELILLAPNAAMATRLRYFQPEILEALRFHHKDWSFIQKLQIKLPKPEASL